MNFARPTETLLRHSHRRLRIAAFALGSICMVASTARADETTGKWSGSIEGRGNYFWERSTRVVVPEVKATVSAPNGIHVGAGYLLDAITSASISAGAASDDLATEYRHGVSAEAGEAFELGGEQLDLTLNAVYSSENDYKSLVVGLDSSLAIDDKDTTLSLSATGVNDAIKSNADPSFDGRLKGFTLGAGLTQVLTPVLVLTLGYQFGYLDGFLGNPYRRALSAGHAPEREAPPETRLRHSVSSRLAWFIPASDTGIHLLYTTYADSWDIAALAPELRIYQQITHDLLLRPRYRFYVQTKASFQRDRYPAGWTGPTTADPKLTGLTTHTIGLTVEYRLGFLANSVFDFARDAWLDIGIDRYLSTSSFGNGVAGSVGGRLEF